ncbi:hypothetical protein [Bradyrhizobium sp. 170]|uniref:hypothetical protein n=1 Tax=Bradyrhizobium sp. 170 TaxID=2782641 RepID=UPI0020001A87|nr:hypothetical protein [Bradyrhizobium sp. 170]UPK07044.1 hypothetical protein IVB05_16825 [Bradyrhizobium sp. 170]
MTPEPRGRFNAITAEVRLRTGLVDRYPHGLSLGNGNASTLRPIAAHPSLVVLDELTSALDVSLRSLIMLLLEALQKRLGLACEQLIATADALRRALPRNLEGLELAQDSPKLRTSSNSVMNASLASGRSKPQCYSRIASAVDARNAF